MDLRFEGDLSLWQGGLLAVAFAAMIWGLYRREVVGRSAWLRWLLPVFRAAAIVLIILMLTGPVLRGQVEVGNLSRVLLFVDESQSMSLTDVNMSPERKLLNARRLGWLPQDGLDTSLHDAARHLASAQQFAQATDDVLPDLEYHDDAANLPSSVVQRMDAAAEGLKRETQSALEVLRGTNAKLLAQLYEDRGGQGASSDPPAAVDDDSGEPTSHASSTVVGAFERQVVEPANRFARTKGSDVATQRGRAADVRSLVDQVARWEQRLTQAFSNEVDRVIERGDAEVKNALDRFDQLSRWQRIESALLLDDNALIAMLRDKHHVELLTTSGTSSDADPRRLWWPHDSRDLPKTLDPKTPAGPVTDLVDGLSSRVAEHKSDQRLAVVLLSDGQHNAKVTERGSPLHLAKVLGSRGIPIFTVGVGADTPPQDLAVLAVKAPKSVFADDRVKGEILIKDDMPAGHPLRVKIAIADELVWEKELTTANDRNRTVEFDFGIKKLVEDRMAQSPEADGEPGGKALSLPLGMTVSIDAVEGEVRDDNNSSEVHVRAITRPRRVLIIDGRPRWEYRYVRNLFERDKQWEVNDVLVRGDETNDAKLSRGKRKGTLPDGKEELFTYDLIVFGEVPSKAFTHEELEWISQFVGSRGGGLVFIDGRRGKMREYENTPLGPLLPVAWTGDHSAHPRDKVTSLSLTTIGRATAALGFEGDSSSSAGLWNQLPPPQWVAPAKALPGSETLIEAIHRANRETSPALVLRRFGAGNVLYSALDETWRWRYEVADHYHARYWNQLANWVMEPPYAVHDRFVSIDTGGFTYQKGEKAEIQVRLRDEQGLPVIEATAEAVLYLNDDENHIVATVPLTTDDNAGGVFRGSTDKLDAGVYRVGVRATGFRDEQLTARAEFAVMGDPTGEMNVLFCDEDLLRQMAHLSGGAYLREEDVASLPARLAPLSEGRVEQRERALWRSWWWFLPLVGLFTTEWIVRKKAGLM